MQIQIIKNKDKLGYIIFLIALTLELIVMMTDHVSGWSMLYRGRITHLAFVLFVFKILTTRYTNRDCLAMMFFGFIGVISYLTCRDEYVIRMVVMFFASKDSFGRKEISYVFVGTMIGTILIAFLAIFGIHGNIVDIRDYGREAIEARYCFGFSHANNLHDIYWYLISLYILLRGENKKLIDYIIMTFLNIGLFLLTGSRTGIITVQLIVIGCAVVKYIRFENVIKYIYQIIALIFMLILSLTIYASYNNIYASKLIAKLDPVFTGRLEALTENAHLKDWKMFPPLRVAEHVDNGFSVIFYTYGIVIGVIFCCVIFYFIFLCKINDRKETVILLLGGILVMFMESTFVINTSVLCNILFLIMMWGRNDFKSFFDNSLLVNKQ